MGPLEEMTYSELQALAKENGIKANQKSSELIFQLAQIDGIADSAPSSAEGDGCCIIS